MFSSAEAQGPHPHLLYRRQQDALEYFQYLLEQISRCERANADRLRLGEEIPATKAAFTFSYEDRVQV